LLNGIPFLNDSEFRSKAYDRVKPLLGDLPAEFKLTTSKPIAGRFVRIELPRNGTLTLAEIEVFSGGKNIAPQGKAKQSSTASGGNANRAIDGKTNGEYGADTSTHTKEDQKNPWWELDLGAEKPIEGVGIWNRTDGELGKRLEGFTVTLLDSKRSEVFTKAGNSAPARSARIPVGGGDAAASIRRAAICAAVAMPRDQEATFAALAGLIAKGDSVTVAAGGMRVLPRAAWAKDQAAAAATALLAWAKDVPAGERTAQDFIETVNVASDLASALPADRATALRRELRDLGVAVFVIKAVREQMRYDTPRLVVEAGKPFEIILVNDDFMQHNLVVVKPGTREKVGKAADVMPPDKLDDRGRAFMPKTTDIVSGTRLLDSSQKATLPFSGLHEEGVFEYVCTYPNHWPSMWGQLVVTRDVDAYLAAHPEAKLPAAVTTGHDHRFE